LAKTKKGKEVSWRNSWGFGGKQLGFFGWFFKRKAIIGFFG